jgi:hypothetical protein
MFIPGLSICGGYACMARSRMIVSSWITLYYFDHLKNHVNRPGYLTSKDSWTVSSGIFQISRSNQPKTSIMK